MANGLENNNQYILTGAGLNALASATVTKIVGNTDNNGATWNSGAKYITYYTGNGGHTSIPVGSAIAAANDHNNQDNGTIRLVVDGVNLDVPVYNLSAASVASATNDADGNNIKTSYAASLSFNDNTLTLESKSGSELSSVSITTNTAGATDTNNKIYLIGAISQDPNPQTYSQDHCFLRQIEPNSTTYGLEAYKVYNAVFNDYAEYRSTIDLTPGHVVIDQDDGTLACTATRLQPGAQVISDTFGHSMGETDTAKTPIAVAGRVLVYTWRPREAYHAGMAVCSAPNGTVDIMTREEIRDYPDCIVGIVSEIPDYETWGSDNVKVDGRIWIRIK